MNQQRNLALKYSAALLLPAFVLSGCGGQTLSTALSKASTVRVEESSLESEAGSSLPVADDQGVPGRVSGDDSPVMSPDQIAQQDSSETSDEVVANGETAPDELSQEPEAASVSVSAWSDCTTPTTPAFYVATSGSDTDPTFDGSISKPFKTLSRAITAMRSSSTKKTTYLRGGTYVLSSTVSLDSRDNNVKIMSYPCETAAIDGAQWLSGYRSEGNNVYSFKVTNPSTWRELIVDWKRWHPATVARFDASKPYTSDWLFAGGGPEKGGSYDWFKFRAGNLSSADFTSLEGMYVQGFQWDRQQDTVLPMRTINFSTNVITMNGAAPGPLSEGTYRIFNNPRFIKDAGDFSWSWKAAEKRVYLKVASTASLKYVLLPTLKRLIEVKGATGVTINRMKFQSVPADGTALWIEGGGSHKIGANNFQWVGTGIRLAGSSDNLIGGNSLSSIGRTGIEMSIGSHRNKIYANSMNGIGQVDKCVAGISGYGVSNNLITQNDIQNSARYGISIKNWDSTTENWNNVIEYNWVYNTCLETADGGAIEMLGRNAKNTGAIIRGNIVDRYNGLAGINGLWYPGFKGFGIYMDDLTSGVTITGNFINGVGYGLANIYLHGGDNNVVEHNIGLMDHEDNEFIRLEYVSAVNNEPNNNKIQRNVIYGKSAFKDYTFYNKGGVNTVDYNLIWNAGRYYEAGVSQDKNSLIANPLFVDPSKGNYQLRSDSPAFKLGIKQPEWGKMGKGGYKPTTTLPTFWN